MFSGLPISLAQLKAANNSENIIQKIYKYLMNAII